MTAKDIIREREEIQHRETHEIVGLRNQLKMVTFHRKDGVSYSVSYAHLLGIEATENFIRLDFRKVQVVVKGKKLSRIHRALVDHRVSYLRESFESRLKEPEKTSIEELIIVSLGSGPSHC
ncbi:hypothetical protein AAFN60_19145 [Roseibacillus persicicus]|uniref:hypothetical protein n=1 Tax=Roseibacillus persicicus TaxID=454148 RepID=UPI00398A67CD